MSDLRCYKFLQGQVTTALGRCGWTQADSGAECFRAVAFASTCVNSVQPLRFIGHVVSEMHVECRQAFQIMLFRTEGRIWNASPESTENRDFPWFIALDLFETLS